MSKRIPVVPLSFYHSPSSIIPFVQPFSSLPFLMLATVRALVLVVVAATLVTLVSSSPSKKDVSLLGEESVERTKSA